MEFNGIIKLDRQIADQLSQYLEEKESKLSHTIRDSLSFESHPVEVKIPVPSVHYRMKLSDSVEIFGKKAREHKLARDDAHSIHDWKEVVGTINNAFWEYLGVLEGCVTELFQQLPQLGTEKWAERPADVVNSIKKMLMHHMEDLKWAIRRMESQLGQYRWACEQKSGHQVWWRKILSGWRSLLDRSLSLNLIKSQKYLSFHYKQFSNNCHEYQHLQTNVGATMHKFEHYHTLNGLDEEVEAKFKKIYELVKLWEMNRKSKAVPQREIVNALKNIMSFDRAHALFTDYYEALRSGLFEKSRSFKQQQAEPVHEDAMTSVPVFESIEQQRSELHALGATVACYRDFLLRTDANPYVRSRWGFSEWIVGPESVRTKQLTTIGYTIQNLDRLFESLQRAREKGPSADEEEVADSVRKEIKPLLYEMNLPLTSLQAMRSNSNAIVDCLKKMNELGSFQPSIVGLVGETLLKAMRADWKYHVLFDIPDFHKIYTIHQGIMNDSRKGKEHIQRLDTFIGMTQQIMAWLKNRTSQNHIQEIEMDVHDIKVYLQSFLASVQRIDALAENESSNVMKQIVHSTHQLLDYQYYFGQFFHELRESEPDERQVRTQFLFVDQYFEAIGSKLQEKMEYATQ